jgi:hypothetical protein
VWTAVSKSEELTGEVEYSSLTKGGFAFTEWNLDFLSADGHARRRTVVVAVQPPSFYAGLPRPARTSAIERRSLLHPSRLVARGGTGCYDRRVNNFVGVSTQRTRECICPPRR